MLPHAALFPGHLHMHRPGSSHPAPGVRTGRLGVLSSLFSSGRGGSFPLFEVRHAALDVLAGGSSVGSSARPQCLALDRSTSLCHRSFHSLTMVICIVFRSAFKGSVASHRFTLSVVSLECVCGMV